MYIDLSILFVSELEYKKEEFYTVQLYIALISVIPNKISNAVINHCSDDLCGEVPRFYFILS